MKLGPVLHQVHHAEKKLGRRLLVVSERHRVDHEIHYIARDLAQWSREHLRRIADVAADYDVDLDPSPDLESEGAGRLREEGSEFLGRTQAPGLLLLEDLRSVYVDAAGVEMDWLLLSQAAQGVRHNRLLEAAQTCRPQSDRQSAWAKAQITSHATQILVS